MEKAWLVRQRRDELHIAYGSGVDLPQYAALHLKDSYLRLCCGAQCGWGTSTVLMPVLWAQGVLYQGAPVDVTWETVGADLVLAAEGAIAGLNVSLQVRLLPPTVEEVVAVVRGAAEGAVPLDRRPGEAFKPVMLSSMQVSPLVWDAEMAYAAEQLWIPPTSGWILKPQPPVRCRTFGLAGGTSDWKKNAPTIRIELDRPMQIAGWITPSRDPDDDNIGLWAASDEVLPSWSYKIVATWPDGCPPM